MNFILDLISSLALGLVIVVVGLIATGYITITTKTEEDEK